MLYSPIPSQISEIPRFSLYIISHWLLFFVGTTTFLATLLTSPTHLEGPFNSQMTLNKEKNIGSLSQPFFLAEASDLHYSVSRKDWNDNVDQLFSTTDSLINPPLITITGDIIDGTRSRPSIQYMGQFEENYRLFNKSLNKYLIKKDRKIILIPGNHDFFSLDHDNSFFREFFWNDTSDFHVRKLVEETSIGKINFIGFTPMNIPFFNAPFGNFLAVSNDHFRNLSAHFDPSTKNILLCHYPAGTMISNRRIRNYALGKADYIITGHTHPSTPVFQFHGGATEVRSRAGFESREIGILTIEKEGAAYSQVSIDSKKPQIVVSYPFPVPQLSSHHTFNLNSFAVKILVFDANTTNIGKHDIFVSINDIEIGKMNFISDVRNTSSFYSLPVNVENGYHTIRFYNKNNTVDRIEFEFLVGGKTEKIQQNNFDVNYYLPKFWFITLGVITFLRVIPWWLIPVIKNKLDNFTFKMYSEEKPTFVDHFLAFLDQFSKLRRAPYLLMIFCFFFAIFPFVLPISVYKVGNTTSIIFSWMVITDNKFSYDVMTYIIGIAFEIFFTIPMIDAIGIWFESNYLFFGTILELCIDIGLYAILIIGWILLSVVGGGLFPYLTSYIPYCQYAFGFVIFWILMINKRKTDASIIDEDLLP